MNWICHYHLFPKFMLHPNSQYLRIPSCIGDGAFEEVIKVKWDHMGHPNPVWLVSLQEEIEHKNSGKKRGEDGHFLAMEERPQKKPALLTPWSWTSPLQNWETIHVSSLSTFFVVLHHGSPSKQMYCLLLTEFLFCMRFFSNQFTSINSFSLIKYSWNR